MRIDRYIHDERLTWGAGFVLLLVASVHVAGIGGLLTARPPDTSKDAAPPIFQVSLERLPPPPLPRAEESEPVSGLQDEVKTVPRKTRPVPILVDTPTTHPVPPGTQVKKYAMGDEKLEGEPGPPSPPGAEAGGTGAVEPAHASPIHWKATLLRMKPPVYPPRCLRMGIEGVVKVRVLVGEDGAPQEITLAKSSGDSALDEAAMQAVHEWLFVPATRNGSPVRAWAVIPIEFKLIN